MYEIVILIVTVLSFLFPVIYSYKKKTNNSMLFIFSSIGGGVVVELLAVGVIFTFIILAIYIIPQAEVLGYTKNIDGMLGILEHLFEYMSDLLIPVVHFAMPILIYNRFRSLFAYKNT